MQIILCVHVDPLLFKNFCYYLWIMYVLQIFAKDSSTSFSLINIYPRQELTDELNSMMLKELNLSPSGTIMVKFNEVSEVYCCTHLFILSKSVMAPLHSIKG